jgi:Leucine-rich repeat (LRR) protein
MTYIFVIAFSAQAQHQFTVTDVPVFRSATDSIEYTQTQNIFQQIVAGKLKNMSADSVLQQMRAVAARSMVGRRKTYFASRSFLTYDSLLLLDDFHSVMKLSISHVEARRLPSKVFQCKNLEYLELVNTSIRRIQKLKKLPNLKSLYVLNNKQLRTIKLSKSRSIKTFGMRGKSEQILPASYRQLSSLEKLDLTDNELTRFPSGIKSIEPLKELLLGNNNLTLENGNMEGSESLEKLELQRNKIKHLPPSIGNFPKLKKLTLNYNEIETVASEISKLKQLEHLSFYNNRLTSIPAGVYELPMLKDVDLYFNLIERVDERIGNLTTLEVLYLSNNKIISISEAIGNLSKLTELYLSNNRLSELPTTIKQLQKLTVLRVNNNYLTQVPRDLLMLNNLENIDISSNSITELPEEVANLNHLKLLVIVNNPWDQHSKERLPSFTEKLRKKEIVVHSD